MDKIKKIEIITRVRLYEELIEALNVIGVTGMTVTHVMGRGNQKGVIQNYRGVNYTPKLLQKVKIEIVAMEECVETILAEAEKVLRTNYPGDGKIFIYDITNVVRIRDGKQGKEALE